MEVQVISNTVQRFNGESFYRCGSYFQRKGKRLHRTVWEYHHGEIPDGYHVHHIDGDRSNNSPGNLALIAESEHQRLHMSTEERRRQSRESVKYAIAKAPEWHSSEKGKAWHSAHAKETWADKTPHEKVCAWCSSTFETRDLGHNHCDVYCCNNHKAAALRWRRKHEGSTDYPGRTR